MTKNSATPSSANSTRPDPAAWSAVVAAPGFSLGIRCAGDHVIGIEFIAPGAARAGASPLAREAARQLTAWLKDPSRIFDLPRAAAGTPFRRQVWAQIAAIPPGHTCTYGDLAKLIGSAPRAVGGACGANPYPLVVPCHRVVAADKGFNEGLGGFARERGGFLLDIKRWLLQHEAPLAPR